MKLHSPIRLRRTSPRRPRWRIHYADYELASLLDNRCLGEVRAFTKTEAEKIAEQTLPHVYPDAMLCAVQVPSQRRAA